ncbi:MULTISPECIES: hypothetical protein [Streptomyces]|uniref:hypothetical protein n=1 Tax=Streptomyces TaxID=1883 RepID=UPI000881717E|nr:hypothetical protein [Streptomyces sp. AmelKG-A3]SDE08464.1 hypothetical protein F558DRAFT_05519 [Streptomyces sp. AmelKG-A3]
MRAAMTRIRFKGAAIAAASVAMGVVLTACGGDSGSDKPEGKDEKTSTPADNQASEGSAPTEDTESQVLGTLKGADGVEVVISSAQRDSGGFITVKGSVKNGSSNRFTAQGWQGTEQEMRNNGASVAGASLVDQTGKKRYLVLRDTDGRCLCTQFVTGIAAGKDAAFFAQFPAPPAETTEVDFQIPTMPTATIKISG